MQGERVTTRPSLNHPEESDRGHLPFWAESRQLPGLGTLFPIRKLPHPGGGLLLPTVLQEALRHGKSRDELGERELIHKDRGRPAGRASGPRVGNNTAAEVQRHVFALCVAREQHILIRDTDFAGQLSLLDRLLTPLILLCMIVGVIIGEFVGNVQHAFDTVRFKSVSVRKCLGHHLQIRGC